MLDQNYRCLKLPQLEIGFFSLTRYSIRADVTNLVANSFCSIQNDDFFSIFTLILTKSLNSCFLVTKNSDCNYKTKKRSSVDYRAVTAGYCCNHFS